MFDVNSTASLAEVPELKPLVVDLSNYKKTFFSWFENYQTHDPYLVASNNSDLQFEVAQNANCKPQLQVDFKGLTLTTNCPGVFHVLKFAYHPSFKSRGGEALHLVSPGFIGLSPIKNVTRLDFGQSKLWTMSIVVSWLSFFVLLGVFFWKKRKS